MGRTPGQGHRHTGGRLRCPGPEAQWREERGRGGAGPGGGSREALLIGVAKYVEARLLRAGRVRQDEGLPHPEGHGELQKGAGPEQGAFSGGLSFLPKAVESPGGLAKPGSDTERLECP